MRFDPPAIPSLILLFALAGGLVAAQEPQTAASRADLSEANALIASGDYAAAELLLATLQADFPEDPRLLLQRGVLLVALGRAGEAVEALRRATELDPGTARAHFQLATALAETGQSGPAIEAYGKARELAEETEIRALAGLNRSMLLQREGRLDEAAGELEAVLALEPGRSNIFGDLATLYMESGRPDEAAAALERGAQAGFLSAAHYYSLGALLYNDGEYETARRMLVRALEIDPAMARAERSLAAALDRLGREDQALQHLRRYLELEPEAPDAARVEERLRAAQPR